jgi:integrase
MISILPGCGFAPGRVGGPEKGGYSNPAGPLGYRRPRWQGQPRAYSSDAELGQIAVDRWLIAAAVTAGRVFRAVSRQGTAWGIGVTENVVWYVVRNCAQRLDLDHLAPHDLRRTCAKLCHVNGGELEQIQFLLGHASVLTTERYLGCKQNLEEPVNDRFGCLFSLGVDSR